MSNNESLNRLLIFFPSPEEVTPVRHVLDVPTYSPEQRVAEPPGPGHLLHYIIILPAYFDRILSGPGAADLHICYHKQETNCDAKDGYDD